MPDPKLDLGKTLSDGCTWAVIIFAAIMFSCRFFFGDWS
jgi:hypothetical protein